MTSTLLALLGSPLASEWSEHELPQPPLRWEVVFELEGLSAQQEPAFDSWLAEMARAEGYGEGEGPRLVLRVEELELGARERWLRGSLEVVEGAEVVATVPLDLNSTGRCSEELRCLLVDSGPQLRSALAGSSLKDAAATARYLPAPEPAPTPAEPEPALAQQLPEEEPWEESVLPPPEELELPRLDPTIQPLRAPTHLEAGFWWPTLTADGEKLRMGDTKMAVREAKALCPPARRRYRATNIKMWSAVGFVVLGAAAVGEGEPDVALAAYSGALLMYAIPPYSRSWIRVYNKWMVTPAGREAAAELEGASLAMLEASPVEPGALPAGLRGADYEDRLDFARSAQDDPESLPQLVTLAATDPAFGVRKTAVWSIYRQCEHGAAKDPEVNRALSHWAQEYAFGADAEALVEVATRGSQVCR